MPNRNNTLRENLHFCLSKLKLSNSNSKRMILPPLPSSPISTTTNKSSSSQPTKSPLTKSQNKPKNTQTAVLFKNFNSLYNSNTSDSSETHHLNSTSSSSSPPNTSPSSSSSFSSERHPGIIDDAAAATASDGGRFFFSSPGHSKSIVHDEATTLICGGGESGDGIFAVPTYSPDPYMDFRMSMEEMVAAQGLEDATAHWDHLHHLLLCYLALNRKNTHAFILSAFADLVVSLTCSGGGAHRS